MTEHDWTDSDGGHDDGATCATCSRTRRRRRTAARAATTRSAPARATRSWSRSTRRERPPPLAHRLLAVRAPTPDRPEAALTIAAQNAASSTSIDQPPAPSGSTDATSKRSIRGPHRVRGEPAARRAARSRCCLRDGDRLDRRARTRSPRRVFTSQNTTRRRRGATTRSSSPSRHAPVAVERPRSRRAAYQARDRVLAAPHPCARRGSAATLRGPCREAPRR